MNDVSANVSSQNELERNLEPDAEPFCNDVDDESCEDPLGVEDEESIIDGATPAVTREMKKEFDAVLVFAEEDYDKAEMIDEKMNQIELPDGSKANVKLYNDHVFGPSIVERPSIICDKSSFVFIIHTENIEESSVANFTKDETIAITRIINVFHKSDSVRSFEKHSGATDRDHPPIRGLAAVPPIQWDPGDESAMKNLGHLFQFQRDEETRLGDISAEKYEINEGTRGLFLLINNIEFEAPEGILNRYSSEGESEALESLFKKIGYNTRCFKNLKAEEIEAKVEAISQEDHTEYESLICYFLSHGKRDVIYGSDVKEVLLDQLFIHLTPQCCSTLAGKPKLIFIDACRTRSDYGTGMLDEMKCLIGYRHHPDFYICYATSPGEISVRNPEYGNWFTEELIKALNSTERRSRSDITGMIGHVEHELSKRKMKNKAGELLIQKPEIIDRLTKRFYFSKPNEINSTKQINLHKEDVRPTASKPLIPKPDPFQEIGLDLLGPFTQKGSQYVLVFTDSRTRWADAEVIPNGNSETIVDNLLKFACTHGMPRSLIIKTDQAICTQLQKFCRNMKIELRNPSPEQQEAENWNTKLCTMISDFVIYRSSDWDTRLPYLLLVYRTMEHELTGTDPFSHVFGRRARLPEGFDIHDHDMSERDIIKRKVETLVNMNSVDSDEKD